MKKKIIFSILFFGILFISAIIYINIIAFTKIRPITKSINQKLVSESFSQTIHIPEKIPPPSLDFKETVYLWEMITPENEVVSVRVKYTPAFSKEDNTLKLTLELPEKGDPSIFNKILPAIITDQKSLKSAQNPQEADLSQNENAGYKSLKIQVLQKTGQAVRLEWEFNKNELKGNVKEDYEKLAKYPKPILSFLYNLPNTVIRIFSA